ncbi:MAG: HAMP domain-containing histidine kinase [Elusimicrobia bacterium]|nr:HAMP domain-containing histidine kinase [Elusimicrobiota bacterium]
MLYQFLAENREKILALTTRKTDEVAQDKPTTPQSERGLPQFYDHLTGELERESKGLPKVAEKAEGPDTTAKHGKELKRLGYNVSQVVQGYAVLSRAIADTAKAAKVAISVDEFKTLNHALDLAVSEAVAGFAKRVSGEEDCAQKMGFLTHELRNALSAAIVAHSMIKGGVVGSGDNTNALLERNLSRMRQILDRSFAEIRMQNGKEVDQCPVFLIDIADEVEATAGEEARARGMTLDVDIGPEIKVLADSHYLISALSNLVQNAIKYSKKGGHIWVRSIETDKQALLEVEDQCGGLPDGKTEELFRPFTQKGADRTGLGLGLTISRQAITLNGGTLTVRDLPAKGCIFTITLPKPSVARSPEEASPAEAIEAAAPITRG